MRTVCLACIALLLPLAASAQTIYRCDIDGSVTYQHVPCAAGARVRELVPAPAPTWDQEVEAAASQGRQRALVRSIEQRQRAEQAAADQRRAREAAAALEAQQRELADLEGQLARADAERRHQDLMRALSGVGFMPAYSNPRHNRR
jgi:hypothetical protein